MQRAQALQEADPNLLVAIFDEQGFYRYVSKAHERFLGYPRREMVGMHWTEVIDEPNLHDAHLVRTLTALKSGRPQPHRFYIHGKYGNRVRITGTVTQFREKGDSFMLTQNRIVGSQGDRMPSPESSHAAEFML